MLHVSLKIARPLRWFSCVKNFSSVGRVCYNGNIYLMGPPGAGKTTVGQILSQKLDMGVLDVDNDFLETYWGMTVADKLKQEGPDNFLRREGEALLDLQATDSIISLSGSNPMHQEAMNHIRTKGVVVFMDVNNTDILERLERMKVNRIVGQTTGVPMADILEYRRQFYIRNYDLRVLCEKDETAESISSKIAQELDRSKIAPKYVSTRSSSLSSNDNFCDVTVKGLAQDGGLYVPQNEIPCFTKGQWESMIPFSYADRAISILEKWIHYKEIPSKNLRQFIEKSYSETNFSNKKICPLVPLHDNLFMAELFHGPSASFKDMALQLMPHFFQHGLAQCDSKHRYLILVATSGDTGGAVLDGFSRHAEDVSLVVLYPEHGVSSLQKAQMTSMDGPNISVVGVDGDFDFCQTTIKNVFTDTALSEKLSEKYGFKLSAANSINWARLLPQMVYHASSYLDLVHSGVISLGEEVDLCIPTGNFGNILGAYYAKNMGIPIKRLICASNTNNVLTEFIKTGKYCMDTRGLLQSISPAIDILKSSNLERYLYYKSDGNQSQISSFYNSLDANGSFVVNEELLSSIQGDIVGDWCSEEQTMATIKNTFETTGYLLDPHTAVAKAIADRFNKGERPIIISSTAHYAKFPHEVLTSLGHDVQHLQNKPAELLTRLENLEVRPAMHEKMSDLKNRERVHHTVCPAAMGAVVEHVEQFIHTRS